MGKLKAAAKPSLPTLSDNEQFLQDAAKRIKERLVGGHQAIVEIGRDLRAVKDRLGHGNFLSWIDREFQMSVKTAERFMALAQHYGDKIVTMTKLNATVLYELAASSTPEEVRKEVEDRVTAGETVTLAKVRQLKKQRQRKEKTEIADQLIEDPLAIFRQELRRLSDLNNVETYRAALTSLWGITPEGVRSWFFEEYAPNKSEAVTHNQMPSCVHAGGSCRCLDF